MLKDKENEKEVQRFKESITLKLRHGYIFVRVKSREEEEEVPAPNINSDDHERLDEITHIPAYLRVAFRLTHLRRWCGMSENDESGDTQIITALDILAKKGAVQIISISQIHDVRYDQLHFEANSGLGWSNFAQTGRQSEATRLYVDSPLNKKERMEGKRILDVKRHVEYIWGESERKLRLKYGMIPVDPSIERELDRDKLKAQTEVGLAAIEAAEALKEKKDAKI